MSEMGFLPAVSVTTAAAASATTVAASASTIAASASTATAISVAASTSATVPSTLFAGVKWWSFSFSEPTFAAGSRPVLGRLGSQSLTCHFEWMSFKFIDTIVSVAFFEESYKCKSTATVGVTESGYEYVADFTKFFEQLLKLALSDIIWQGGHHN